MDRNIVYAGSIPLDTDLLSLNLDTMLALNALAQVTLGTTPIVDGLGCAPTSSGLSVVIAPGSITALAPVDDTPYGSLGTDTADTILKMGINIQPTTLPTPAPTTSGQSIAYLIQAAFQETDTNPVTLPYYNASNPTQPFSGPNNSGTAQPTMRRQTVALEVKAGPIATGTTPTLPPVDSGWIGLYSIVVNAGDLAVNAANITPLITAPWISFKLPQLRPGFGSGTTVFTQSGLFTVPAGVTQVEVELWGGGAVAFGSTTSTSSGGGSAGGYARKVVTGLTPGQIIPVAVGDGGPAPQQQGGSPSNGGTSSFGNYVSATGGMVSAEASPGAPQFGGGPGGAGVGGDVNISGSCGQPGLLNIGGMGGAAAGSTSQGGGLTTGVDGLVPGGGGGGAGTGSGGNTEYSGSEGGNGLVVIRY